jgi:hypothetical protein
MGAWQRQAVFGVLEADLPTLGVAAAMGQGSRGQGLGGQQAELQLGAGGGDTVQGGGSHGISHWLMKTSFEAR